MTTLVTRATVILLVALLSFACSENDDANTAGPTPPTIQTQAPNPTATPGPTSELSAEPNDAVVLADGKHPVFITKVDVAGSKITFDLVRVLTGDEAKAEWLRQNPDDPSDTSFMIVNNNPLLRTLPVTAGAPVKVFQMNEGVDLVVQPPFVIETDGYRLDRRVVGNGWSGLAAGVACAIGTSAASG